MIHDKFLLLTNEGKSMNEEQNTYSYFFNFSFAKAHTHEKQIKDRKKRFSKYRRQFKSTTDVNIPENKI